MFDGDVLDDCWVLVDLPAGNSRFGVLVRDVTLSEVKAFAEYTTMMKYQSLVSVELFIAVMKNFGLTVLVTTDYSLSDDDWRLPPGGANLVVGMNPRGGLTELWRADGFEDTTVSRNRMLKEINGKQPAHLQMPDDFLESEVAPVDRLVVGDTFFDERYEKRTIIGCTWEEDDLGENLVEWKWYLVGDFLHKITEDTLRVPSGMLDQRVVYRVVT